MLLTTVGDLEQLLPAVGGSAGPGLLRVTVGIKNGQALSEVGALGQAVWNQIVTGSVLSVDLLVVAFSTPQKYWRGRAVAAERPVRRASWT